MQFYSIVDFLFAPIVLFIIVVLARVRKYRLLEEHSEYKYFTKGLYFKLIGGISFVMAYTLYYGGGDTVNYFHDASCMMRLLFQDPVGFYAIMKDGLSPSTLFYFNQETGYPIYFRDDKATFYVVRIAAPIVILSAGSILVSTMLFATISFWGLWRLYQLFIMEFPTLKREMAIAILFVPSVFFWGSGIMKDTITLTCIGFYSYSFYKAFIRRENILPNLIAIAFSVFFIIQIKPYIIFALLPGSVIWIVNKYVGSISNKVIKFLIGPFMLIMASLSGYLLLVGMGDVLGTYSVDKVLDRAVITSQDLKADYYGGNSFDIGDYDATIPSMLAKAPAAINVALFRPYLWEANNIVMFISGLEVLVILIFTIRIMIRVRIIGAFTNIAKNHLLVFSLIFSLFFAFSVGISTSNFGSLVRYRIPSLPFFIASLYIIDFYYRQAKARKLENDG
jgi:hypothetical protein